MKPKSIPRKIITAEIDNCVVDLEYKIDFQERFLVLALGYRENES